MDFLDKVWDDTPQRCRRFFVVGMVVVVLLWLALATSNAPPAGAAVKAPTKAQTIAIPGLNYAVYTPGLADRFASYKSNPKLACQKWNSLTPDLQDGLSFVDPKVVPACANRGYVAQANAEHRSRPADFEYSRRVAYADLGHPAVSSNYGGYTYTCAYLTGLTKSNYTSPPGPKLTADQWAELTNMQNFDPTQMTAKQKRELQQDNQAQAAVEKYSQAIFSIEDMYSDGGNFDKDCYPPGVIFGKDLSVEFYPNHPVKSIRESAAPVFFGGGGGSTMMGVGKRYVVQSGDSPYSVAQHFYSQPGDDQFDDPGSNWPLIIAANHLSTPLADGSFDLSTSLKWYVGLVIYLPDTSSS